MPMSPRLLRPRATGFNPRNITGLALWLDATDASTYTVATGVSEWRDKSGNARKFAQSIGNNQPTISTLNGKTALSFNGASHRLTTSGTLLTGNGSFTLFQAMECSFPGGVGTAGRSFEHRTATGGPDDNAIAIEWRADQGASWVSGTLRSRVQSFRSSVAYNADQRFDSVNVSGRGIVTLTGNFNAASATSTAWWKNSAAPSTLGTSDPGTVLGMAIGCRNNATASLFFGGVIGEVICYVGTISTAQRLAVQGYLASKWGVTLS